MNGPEKVDRREPQYAPRLHTGRAAATSDDGASTNMSAHVEEEHHEEAKPFGPTLAERYNANVPGHPGPILISPAEQAIAFMRATGELRAPSPPQLAVLAKSEPMGAPNLVPMNQLHSKAEVDAAIHRERAFLATAGKLISPEEHGRRAEHIRELEYLQRFPAAINDGRPLLEKLHAQRADEEQKEIASLRAGLEQLGGREMWRSTDSLETLRDRYHRLAEAHEAKQRETESKRLYMGGTDGYVGTAEEVQRYEDEEFIAVSVGTTTPGSIAANVTHLVFGGDTNDMRRVGQFWDNVQDFAQTVAGVDLTKLPRQQGPDTRVRGQRRDAPPPGLGPRQRDMSRPGLERASRANEPGARASVPTEAVDAYARAVRSNREWSWEHDIPGSAALSGAQRRAVKQQAIERGLIPDVQYKPGTRFPDFQSAGLVIASKELPQELWLKGDKAQFSYLDGLLPGGRPPGTTWHHTETPGRMELVPFGPHNILNHEGGRSKGRWAHAPR